MTTGPDRAATARDRRTLTFGVVAVALVLLVGRVVPAYRAWLADAVASAGELTAEAERAEQTVATRGAVRDTAAARATRAAALEERLLPGATAAAAGGALVAAISDAAAHAGVRLGSVQLHAAAPAAGSLGGTSPAPSADAATAGPQVERVTLQAEAAGDVRAVTQLLRAIETNRRLLAVHELTVTQASPTAPDAVAEELRVQLVVDGLARIGSVADPAKRRAALGADSVMLQVGSRAEAAP